MDENEFLAALKLLKIKWPAIYRHIVGIIKSVLMI
jgi:hypothetical protein